MAWVKGLISGEVTKGGQIIAHTRDLQVMVGVRPRNIQESWATPAVFERIRRREPGAFETMAFLGGATAMLVPFTALALLDEQLMARLLEKYYGYMREGGAQPAFPELVAIMHVRNVGAPVRQCDAEPSGGMAETIDLLAAQVGEMVEMGICRDDGWVKFLLPDELSTHQPAFDRVQSAAWEIVRPGFQCAHEAQLELLSVGRDQFNGRPCIITAGPVGDFSTTNVAKLHLAGTGWKFLDTEDHNGMPLRRRMVAIMPRQGRSPVVLQLNNEGALDERGHNFVLDGENRELAITHIGRAVLEELEWLP